MSQVPPDWASYTHAEKLQWHKRAQDRCMRCGRTRLNVSHETAEQRAGDPYFDDNPTVGFCEFTTEPHP